MERGRRRQIRGPGEGPQMSEIPPYIQKPSIEEIAYHEAGHVVLHVVLKIPFESATISPMFWIKGNLGGVVAIQAKWSKKSWRENEYVCILAGPVCQCMYSRKPCCWESGGVTYTHGEVNEVFEMLRRTCSSNKEAVQRFEYYLHRTERMLIRFSSKVHLIAAALIDNEHLTSEQIHWLFIHSSKMALAPNLRPPDKMAESPAILLSGLLGSCESYGFYSPTDNEIQLTSGLRFAGEDEAEYYTRALCHELAHWASFLHLSRVERAWVMRKYHLLRLACGGDASRDSIEERFACYASGEQ